MKTLSELRKLVFKLQVLKTNFFRIFSGFFFFLFSVELRLKALVYKKPASTNDRRQLFQCYPSNSCRIQALPYSGAATPTLDLKILVAPKYYQFGNFTSSCRRKREWLMWPGLLLVRCCCLYLLILFPCILLELKAETFL